MDKQDLRFKIQLLKLGGSALYSAMKFLGEEKRRGSLISTIRGLIKERAIPNEMSWGDLLEERAEMIPDKKFLLYNDEVFTYKQMNENANKVADFLKKHGGGKGRGLGVYMKNSPRVLDLFFGANKIGMYLVPMNPALMGDGLAYIINHSDIEFFALDAEIYENFKKISKDTKNLKYVIVDDIEEEAKEYKVQKSKKTLFLSEAFDPKMSTENPGVGYNLEDMSIIMYTSGTTGLPKGVVYRYSGTNIKLMGMMANLTLKEDDIYYTPLPLIHGNAFFITVTLSMLAKATVALSRKFSASKFWEEVRGFDATIFNALGSMIPILMKQPPKPSDSDNKVRYVMSAACPSEMWEEFERRYGVIIYEGYGAVDGGGKGIINFQTAPVGSIGKPSKAMGEMRLIDDNGNEVPQGEPGELIYKVSGKGKCEYYKNEKASNEKIKDGWLYTGDLIRKDEKGYFYFVGRNTESMRRGGENVSAYEVEHVIMKHPAAEEVAVYAVPSELAEDEIMASIRLVKGKKIQEKEIHDFLQDKLAKYAIPRYIRFVSEFNKTSTHRIIKKELEDMGITPDTFDSKAKPKSKVASKPNKSKAKTKSK